MKALGTGELIIAALFQQQKEFADNGAIGGHCMCVYVCIYIHIRINIYLYIHTLLRGCLQFQGMLLICIPGASLTCIPLLCLMMGQGDLFNRVLPTSWGGSFAAVCVGSGEFFSEHKL